MTNGDVFRTLDNAGIAHHLATALIEGMQAALEVSGCTIPDDLAARKIEVVAISYKEFLDSPAEELEV